MNKRHQKVKDQRSARSERRWLVHEAGCVFCTVKLNADIISEWVEHAHRDGVRIPRSFRRYVRQQAIRPRPLGASRI